MGPRSMPTSGVAQPASGRMIWIVPTVAQLRAERVVLAGGRSVRHVEAAESVQGETGQTPRTGAVPVVAEEGLEPPTRGL